MQENTDFQRLQAEQQNFKKVLIHVKREKFKQDYVNLKERLQTLPDQLNYDIMVPFGKFAFMPGKLVHTNEILVLLGDNWFVDRSAKQASEIIHRRLDGIERHLDKLKKEMKIFTDQLNWTSNMIKESKDYVNIEEKYEEPIETKKSKTKLSEEEKLKQREYLQNKAKMAQMKINERIQSDLLSRKSQNIKESEESEDEEEEDEAIKNEEIVRNKKTVRWSDSKVDFKERDDEEDETDENDYSDSSDDSIYEINKPIANNVIYVTHTTNTESENTATTHQITSTQSIQSPADIYRFFYKPKSILKNQSLMENLNQDIAVVPKQEEKIKLVDETTKFDAKKAFTGSIVERTEVAEIKPNVNFNEPTKKISKFKASKQQ